MSIINQTLRELDARKHDAASPVPLRPVATVLRRGPGRWIAAAALLLIAGLLAWAVSGPGESVPQTTAGPAPRAVIPAPRVPPAPAAALVRAPAPAQPGAVAATRPEVDSAARMRETPAEHPAPSPATQPAAENPPVIRKEISRPTAEEEAEERYRKALTLLQKGRENQARLLLEEAIRLSPGHVAARQALVTLLSEAGQNQDAEAVLREGRVVVPDNAWFALSLARLQAARGDVEGAAASLLSGIEGRGVDAEYHATLAALFVRLERHPEAARQYQQALKLQPDQGMWWLGLGLSLDAQGKTDEARSAFGRVLAAGNLPEKLATFVREKLAK